MRKTWSRQGLGKSFINVFIHPDRIQRGWALAGGAPRQEKGDGHKLKDQKFCTTIEKPISTER